MTKRLWIIIAVLSFAVSIGAKQYMTCHPVPNVDGYLWRVDYGSWHETKPEDMTINDKSYIRVMERDKLEPGRHIIHIKSFKYDKKWGRIESDQAEVEFIKD